MHITGWTWHQHRYTEERTVNCLHQVTPTRLNTVIWRSQFDFNGKTIMISFGLEIVVTQWKANMNGNCEVVMWNWSRFTEDSCGYGKKKKKFQNAISLEMGRRNQVILKEYLKLDCLWFFTISYHKWCKFEATTRDEWTIIPYNWHAVHLSSTRWYKEAAKLLPDSQQ